MLASFAGTTIAATSKQQLQRPRDQNAPVGKQSNLGFTGQRFGRLVPRPGRIAVRNSSHREDHSTRSLGASFTPVLPPLLPQSNLDFISDGGLSGAQSLPGNSSTEAARRRTGATRHGFRFSSRWTTTLVTIQIDHVNGEAHGEGVHPMTGNDPQALVLQGKLPASVPISPRKRDQWVSAMRKCVAR